MVEGPAKKTEQGAATESAFDRERQERVKRIREVFTELYAEQQKKDDAKGVPELFHFAPDMHDELTRAFVELQAMQVTDDLLEKAVPLFGRAVTGEESAVLHTVLDYIFKRIVLTEMGKAIGKNLTISRWEYFGYARTGMFRLLPGDTETFMGHDLVHIVLAVKQGLLNENSPIPTFLRDATDFDTSPQAMLEEAFAVLFTAGIGTSNDYDTMLRNPEILRKETMERFNPPTKRGVADVPQEGSDAVFSTATYAKEAVQLIAAFYDANKDAVPEGDLLTLLALFSQEAAYGESLGSSAFTSLSEPEKVAFIERHLVWAQRNITALLTGEVTPGTDAKYAQTVQITRETYFNAQKQHTEHPESPIFIEILLETLAPLYNKAKAQAEGSFGRVEKSV